MSRHLFIYLFIYESKQCKAAFPKPSGLNLPSALSLRLQDVKHYLYVIRIHIRTLKDLYVLIGFPVVCHNQNVMKIETPLTAWL